MGNPKLCQGRGMSENPAIPTHIEFLEQQD
jgi:hypothetical protein